MSANVKNDTASAKDSTKESGLETGTYEIIRKRLEKNCDDLKSRLDQLNESRKKVFGSVEPKLIANQRITTENACIPSDMVSIGNKFIFGYNVHLGLKPEPSISDVFSEYEFDNGNFKTSKIIGDNPEFQNDFLNLYRFYKKAQFVRFGVTGNYLFMIFRVGNGINDLKTFKWLIEKDDSIVYLDDRGDLDFKYPEQHSFQWERPLREDQVLGKHSHISIKNLVFVETIGGDLTIKIENNTDSGKGIYSEPVEVVDQTLDDAEIYFALIGNLIVLKIRPYSEKNFRYIVYNHKVKEAHRIDAIEAACILLPENHGIIFSNGYYLQNGEYKLFDIDNHDLSFEKRIASANGEDYLYIFYSKQTGTYSLLSYNLIEHKIIAQIQCNGYTIFPNGTLCYFSANNEPQRHHAIQVWQTPFIHADYEVASDTDSYLYTIGNKDIVRGMSDCREIITLVNRGDSYAGLYVDLVKLTTDVIDAYYWIVSPQAFTLNEPLIGIRDSSQSAIEEYEKVLKIKQTTKQQIAQTIARTDDLLQKSKRVVSQDINSFVEVLANFRKCRGELINLKDLRYTDLTLIEKYESAVDTQNSVVMQECVTFLLRDDALQPYHEKVVVVKENILKVAKVVDANELEKDIQQTSEHLNMLTDIVGNLKIADATQTTKIIDNISLVFSSLNQLNASLKNKKKEIFGQESKAQFAVQLKLISQTMLNYIDLSDTPAKCDESQSKLLIQLEELDGKFGEFDEFSDQTASVRNDIIEAFETKKLQLIELQNKTTTNLLQSADRILKTIAHKIAGFSNIVDINGYYASDLMVDKVREIVERLIQIGDTVKSDEILSKLKTVREEALRQLKDKNELFVEGENVIKLGNHAFNVSTQNVGLTMVLKNNEMFYHITGTGFFEKVKSETFNDTQHFWNQMIVSETENIYKAEFLTYQIVIHTKDLNDLVNLKNDKLIEHIQDFMSSRFEEGYVKGVHDNDTAKILSQYLQTYHSADLIRYKPQTRACAEFYMSFAPNTDFKTLLIKEIKGMSLVLKAFPGTTDCSRYLEALHQEIHKFYQSTNTFSTVNVEEVAEYLFHELITDNHFVIDDEAYNLCNRFSHYLVSYNLLNDFENSIHGLSDSHLQVFELVRNWIKSWMNHEKLTDKKLYIDEIAITLINKNLSNKRKIKATLKTVISTIIGSHALINNGNYVFDFYDFNDKMKDYQDNKMPAYKNYVELKNQLLKQFEHGLKLHQFKPRVLSSFIRNKLIDKLYLPVIGNNLAKQIGAAGENKRTDLMGMLLLISPPGYGKTTLMEYIAFRLGLIFMKINGPSIGHQITSLDPQEAKNASAREELEKLNLSFEMGNNVMIYLDDIQHLNPEFLQKFISLADAQRKIEGVYKQNSKTYDFRGKKVCLVMAGNPYTESGEKFQIPDMLANRADIYNIGDIIGGYEKEFLISYIENAMSSNPVLNRLIAKSQKDLYVLLELIETGNKESSDFETQHSPEEIQEYISILKKLNIVKEILYKVNKEYIHSAGQQDAYRTQPPFKLQGSYRNMNKIAEKIIPLMNDNELRNVILAHYTNESQTLAAGAEANLLQFKQMYETITPDELKRWEEIKAMFNKNQRLKGLGGDNQMAQFLIQFEALNDTLLSIKNKIITNYTIEN